MNEPRPESRIRELEGQMATQGARIRELADDTAEELKVIGQDIKQLNEGMMASFKRIGEHFGLLEKENATKADLTALESRITATQAEHSKRFDKLEATQAEQGKKLDEQGQLLREILARLPKQE